MPDEMERLTRAARQLLAVEELLGGEFLPRGRNDLPAVRPAARDDPRRERCGRLLGEMDRDEVGVCTRCGLHQGRTQTVFGEGDCCAELVFVGEAPGQEEDATGRPFVGRAGELLTKMIRAMGLRREDVFICNVIKCRPPDNRTPAPGEVEACRPYLLRQLEIIRPKVIVTLGNPAAKALLGTRVGITRLRGQWQGLPLIGDNLQGIAVMPTFHPAYLLRQYTKDNRAKVWSDLQKVMDCLGLAPPTPE